MLCEKCKINSVNIKYTQNINGIEIEHNLCESCFKKFKYDNYFIDSFLNSFFSINSLIDEYEENYKCKICQNTLETLKNTGKIGCINCYSVFRDKLDFIFNNIQAKNVHTGKMPKNLETYKPSIDTIKLLKQNLNLAIQNEDYEEAIKIRDKIRELERGDI